MSNQQRQEALQWMIDNIPYINEYEIELRREFNAYIIAVEGTVFDADFNPITWALQYKDRLPWWFKTVRLALLFHPTSATVERIFSLCNNYLLKTQNRLGDMTLQYYLSIAYNRRGVKNAGNDEDHKNPYADVPEYVD
jgi:hypothetical protein